MPRLCANLKWLFTEEAFLDRFDAAARAGFRAVEYASPYEYSARELRNRLKATGLTQVLINTPTGDPESGGGSGFACIPGRQHEFRDGMVKALEYATELDCKLVHVMAGIQPTAVTRDAAFATYMVNLAWAADLASREGIRIVLEAVNQRSAPGFFLQSQEQSASIVEALGRDRLGIEFDVFHCHVAQGDVTRRLEALMPIDHIQIADSPNRSEPGTGEIAWDYIFARVDLGYQGWVGCEYHPLKDTIGGLQWRRRFGV
jgi:hydroxypyruvate isomerase